jgi:hypothetical protein
MLRLVLEGFLRPISIFIYIYVCVMLYVESY